MRFNPCGRIVDFTRRSHDEPCRFFRNSDRIDTVRFVDALPDAPVLGMVSIVYPSEWDDQRWPFEDLPGTLRTPPFKFTGRVYPAGALFDHVCGTEQDFNEGGLYEPDKPPQPVGAEGLPLCCFPSKRVVGGSASGGVATYHVRKMRAYGGSASGGVSNLVIQGDTDPTSGGIEIGGSVGDRYVWADPTSGGIEIGGSAGDVYDDHAGYWLRTVPDTYTFTAPATSTYRFRCYGAGGGGEDPSGGLAGTGGGGGGFSQTVISLTEGDSVTVVVGAGGPHGFGAVPPGGESNVTSVMVGYICRAFGGLAGAAGGGGGGTGGAVGDVTNGGGNGAANDGTVPGGGGASGTVSGTGTSAIDIQGAVATPPGGDGGWGQTHDVTQFPKQPGGGGGGGEPFAPTDGDPGADGLADITWPAPP